MNANSTHAKTIFMVQLAFLAAVEVILTLLYIPVGTINLNFGLVPLVIAGMMFGPGVGCFIGAVSGVVTMIQVLTGQSVVYLFLVAANPVVASLLCIVKTAAAGLISGLVYQLFVKLNQKKNGKHPRSTRLIGAITSAALCPIVNTGIFAIAMLTVFGDALMKDPVISTWTTGGLFALVFLALIGVNFIVELISTIVIVPPLNEALVSSKLIKRK